jgi:L-fuconolactonase
MTGVIVDSHLHVWDLSTGGYGWLTPAHGVLHQSYLPDQAERELAQARIAAAILVQADDTEADTRYLLGVAERSERISAVVGWIPLDDPPAAERSLDTYAAHPALCGIRHLVHDDPRPDFLSLPTVRDSLRLLARRGLPFDVPDAWPGHLAAIAELADALPTLSVVVDHLAKPPRGGDAMGEWERQFRAAAARPNTYAKVSGLQQPGQPFTAAALRPVLDIALDAYGPDRLLYGSDWPITVPWGGYQAARQVMADLLGELSETEQRAIYARTATTVYGLGPTAADETRPPAPRSQS